jgi:hypothetical protein
MEFAYTVRTPGILHGIFHKKKSTVITTSIWIVELDPRDTANARRV